MGMKLEAFAQERVQRDVAGMTPDERLEAMAEAYQILDLASDTFQKVGRLDATMERVCALMIETIVRCESVETGKGSFFRFKRRLALVHKYFKP